MYEKFLPKFHVVELNLSTAHLIGHVIAQTPAYVKTEERQTDYIASVKKNDYTFVENGVIVGLDQKGVLANYDPAKHAQPCLVYQDELITGPFDNLNQFAEYVDDVKKPVYVRALPLYLNDTFTTDNFTGQLADGYAKVNKEGQLEIASGYEAGVTIFIVKKTTLPNREPAGEFTYIGAPAKVGAGA